MDIRDKCLDLWCIKFFVYLMWSSSSSTQNKLTWTLFCPFSIFSKGFSFYKRLLPECCNFYQGLARNNLWIKMCLFVTDGHSLKRICGGFRAQKVLPIVSLDGKSLIAEIWYERFVLLECHIRNIFHARKTHVAMAFIYSSLVKEMFRLLEETGLRIHLTNITNTHPWWKDRKRIVAEPETIDVTPWNASSRTVKLSPCDTITTHLRENISSVYSPAHTITEARRIIIVNNFS